MPQQQGYPSPVPTSSSRFRTLSWIIRSVLLMQSWIEFPAVPAVMGKRGKLADRMPRPQNNPPRCDQRSSAPPKQSYDRRGACRTTSGSTQRRSTRPSRASTRENSSTHGLGWRQRSSLSPDDGVHCTRREEDCLPRFQDPVAPLLPLIMIVGVFHPLLALPTTWTRHPYESKIAF